MDTSKISEARVVIYENSNGTSVVKTDVFKGDKEKERASAIGNQLKGLTIREAQTLLMKISDVLIDFDTLK